MKQSEAKHFLPIIKAWSEGKTLQLWDSTDKVWRDCTIDPIFTSKPELYRIKPEPRTQDVNEGFEMSIYAWHFTDGNFLRDGSPLPAVGEWLKYSGKIRICQTGYHFSRTPWDALKYAPGDTLHLVECDEIEDEHSDKGVCRRRRIIASMDAAEMLRYFARMQALSVIMDAPEMEDVVYSWLFSGDSAARSAARSAADSAARSVAYSAAYYAARSTADSAADSTIRSAAYSAAYSATHSAARYAADSAAYSAVRSAADSAAATEFNMLVWECFEGPMKKINWDGK